MIKRRIGLALVLTGCTLAGGAACAASVLYSRPVMPSFVVDLAPADAPARSLILVYGERGSDPARNGTLGPDQRIAACSTSGSTCTSPAARDELHLVGTRAQSVQIRLFTGSGNPILGAVRWTGPAYPRQVRLKCDARIPDVHRACAVVAVQS